MSSIKKILSDVCFLGNILYFFILLVENLLTMLKNKFFILIFHFIYYIKNNFLTEVFINKINKLQNKFFIFRFKN